jgi:hypothetical protein
LQIHGQFEGDEPTPVCVAKVGMLVQAGQTVSAVAEQTEATYWPLAQVLQLVPTVTPERQYWLARQSSFVDGFGQKKPAGHRVCDGEPDAQ